MYVGSLERLNLFQGHILKELVDTATLACRCRRGAHPINAAGNSTYYSRNENAASGHGLETC